MIYLIYRLQYVQAFWDGKEGGINYLMEVVCDLGLSYLGLQYIHCHIQRYSVPWSSCCLLRAAELYHPANRRTRGVFQRGGEFWIQLEAFHRGRFKQWFERAEDTIWPCVAALFIYVDSSAD